MSFSNIYVNMFVQQQTTHINERFYALIFPYLMKRMVLKLTMKLEINFK